MSNRLADKRATRDARAARLDALIAQAALRQFLTAGFFGRLRWLLFGVRIPK